MWGGSGCVLFILDTTNGLYLIKRVGGELYFDWMKIKIHVLNCDGILVGVGVLT